MKDKIILVLIVFGIIAGTLYLVNNEEEKIETGEKETFEVPKINDFTFYDIEGNKVSLHSFAGKPMILNVWASWCTPCQDEMPVLQESFRKHGDDVQYIFLDLEGVKGETKESAINFLVENSLTDIPIYFDTDKYAMYTLAIRQIPMTYLINSDLTLNYSYIGKVDEVAFEDLVLELKESNNILTESN